MSGGYILILLIAIITILFAVIAKSASFLKRFAEETRQICSEMDHAESYKEYRRLYRELRCHYLMLIPFVNEKNVERVYRLVFRKGEHVKKKERKDSLVPILFPSLLGICLCLVCVCSMTWAWYSASVSGSTGVIQAARYEIDAAVLKGGAAVDAGEDGVYTLSAGTYTVTLTAKGDASTGYCKITVDDQVLYTQQLYTSSDAAQKTAMTFTLVIPNDQTKVDFYSAWGTYSGEVNIHDGTTYTVPASGSAMVKKENAVSIPADTTGSTVKQPDVKPSQTTQSPVAPKSSVPSKPTVSSTVESLPDTQSVVSEAPAESSEPTVSSEPTESVVSTVESVPNEAESAPEVTE